VSSRSIALEHALERHEGDVQAAVLDLAGLGRNALADKIHVDAKVLSRTLAGSVPGLHVRRALEQELGLGAYELDRWLP